MRILVLFSSIDGNERNSTWPYNLWPLCCLVIAQLALPPRGGTHSIFIFCQCNYWYLTAYGKKHVQCSLIFFLIGANIWQFCWFISYWPFLVLSIIQSYAVKVSFLSHCSECKQPWLDFVILSLKHVWLAWWYYDIDDNRC